MHYHSRVPRPPLSSVVEVLWYYAGDAIGCGSEWAVADGRCELVINLRDDPPSVRDGGSIERLTGATLCGPRTAPYELAVPGRYELMGAVFRPGGAPAATGVAADELFGTWVGADAVWGSDARWLHDRLRSASTVDGRFEALEQALAGWVARRRAPLTHPVVVHAVEVLMREPHARPVRTLHAELPLSGRHVTQLFRESVGMPPKRFARIQRFQRTLEALEATAEPDWAQLALAAGYVDQPHMAREFRELAGLSPTRYRRARTRHLDHVPRGVHPFHTVCGAGCNDRYG